MKVLFRESFLRDLRAIKDQSVLRRIKGVLETSEEVHRPTDIPNLKKLHGQGQYYRIRIGEYRLKIEADTITFVRALNRKEVYRYFP